MIKIVHTADLHLGLEFSRYPAIADQLKEERLYSLKLIVNRANQEGAHAIVVAGDLFDKLSVPQKLVREAKSILAMFKGEVIVIPGNHDWYNASANENKVWTWFLDAPGDNVHFLNQWRPYTLTLNSREVVFYPCGCHQKHCDENLIDWVHKVDKRKESVNIGIAHGNVEGYGLDEEGCYFNMSKEELRDVGLDFWLLGHIHAPYPDADVVGHEVFYFAGSHCSESWKNERTGGSWLIEVNVKKEIKATRWHHSGICFRDRTYTIESLTDLQQVISEIKKMSPAQTVMRLTLHGSLTEEELQEAKIQIAEATKSFLHFEPYWSIGLRITSEAINKLFVKDSIPHMLLTSLSQNEDDTLAMQLAYKTIKSISK